MFTKPETDCGPLSSVKSGDGNKRGKRGIIAIASGGALAFLVSSDLVIVKTGAWLSFAAGVQVVCDHIPCPHILPATSTPSCETAEHYQDAKNAGAQGLINYIDECNSYSTGYLIDAKNSLEKIEYSDFAKCIVNNCRATVCLDKSNHLSVEQIEQLNSQAKQQENSASCRPRETPPAVSKTFLSAFPRTIVPADKGKDQSDARDAAVVAWSNERLNLSTKKRLPISIIAPEASDPSHFRDRPAANALSDMLFSEFNLVAASEAALLVEVSDVDAEATQSGHPFPGSYRSQWDGTASVSIKAIWAGGTKVLFPSKTFTASAPSDDDTAAAKAALDAAIVKAKTFLLGMATQQQNDVRRQ